MKVTVLLNYLIDGINPITENSFLQGDPLLDRAVKLRLKEIRDEIVANREAKSQIKHNNVSFRINFENLARIAIVTPHVSFKDLAYNISFARAVETIGAGNGIDERTKPTPIMKCIYNYLVSIGALIEQHNFYGKLFYSTTKFGEELGILVEEDTRFPGGIATAINVSLQKKLIDELPKILDAED